MISMSIVIGNLCQFMTRHLSKDYCAAPSWSSNIKLSDKGLCQLSFWESNLTLVNNRFLHQNPSYSRIVYSDASNVGYSGYEVKTFKGIMHGMWQEDESLKYSTWKELMAVFRVLSSME